LGHGWGTKRGSSTDFGGLCDCTSRWAQVSLEGPFGAGVAAGLISEELALRGDVEWKRGTSWWEDEDCPAKRMHKLAPQFNELAASEPMTREVADQARGLIAEAKRLSERAAKEGRPTIAKVRRSTPRNGAAAGLRRASLLGCGLGVGALLFEASF
jgi:hypothetical protein